MCSKSFISKNNKHETQSNLTVAFLLGGLYLVVLLIENITLSAVITVITPSFGVVFQLGRAAIVHRLTLALPDSLLKQISGQDLKKNVKYP